MRLFCVVIFCGAFVLFEFSALLSKLPRSFSLAAAVSLDAAWLDFLRASAEWETQGRSHCDIIVGVVLCMSVVAVILAEIIAHGIMMIPIVVAVVVVVLVVGVVEGVVVGLVLVVVVVVVVVAVVVVAAAAAAVVIVVVVVVVVAGFGGCEPRTVVSHSQSGVPSRICIGGNRSSSSSNGF